MPEFTEADAERQLEEILAHGDRDHARRLLARWRDLFLPHVPPSITNNVAICDRRFGWTRERRKVTPLLLLGHFEGNYALGGIYAGTTRVVCIDLDNQAGKHAGPAREFVRLDPDLAARRRLVEVAAPEGVWVRSSHSHGLHYWILVEDAVPIERLPPLLCQRLKAAVPRVAGLSRVDEFLNAPPSGLDGWLEIHPYQQPGGQGRVIRSPCGPGSAVFTRDGRVFDRPGPALRYLLDELRPVRLVDLAPGRVETQLALPPLPRRHTFIPPTPTPPPPGNRVHDPDAQLRACDGRLSASLRADFPTQARIAHRIRRDGCPARARHASTFLLAYVAKRNGVPEQRALDQMIEWSYGPAFHRSREMQKNHYATVRKGESIVRYVYSYEKRNAGQRGHPRRYRAPGPVRRDDLLRLQELLEHDGYTVKLAARVLGFARTNGYYEHPSGRLLCELPVEALGVRSRRARDAFQRLGDAGLLVLRRRAIPRWPKGCEGDPACLQQARARLFAVHWRYADRGSGLPRRAMAPRRPGQVSRRQMVIGCFAPTRRVLRSVVGLGVGGGGCGVEACGRCGPGPAESSFEAGPNSCGNPVGISKGLVDVSPQARQLWQRPWATRVRRTDVGMGGAGGKGGQRKARATSVREEQLTARGRRTSRVHSARFTTGEGDGEEECVGSSG